MAEAHVGTLTVDGNRLLDGIPYLVWTYDAGGIIDYVNAAWSAYTGSRLRETRGPELLPASTLSDGSSSVAQSLSRAMAAGTAVRTEVQLRQRSGEYRWHAVTVEPVSAPGGAITGWVGTAIDIEDRKHVEHAFLAREAEYQKEIVRSVIFQRAVLPPHLPELPGLSFDAIYEPGMSDEQVGGDWYDAVRLIDGRVMVTIGDVAGHGLNAAVIMSVVRQIMRGIAQLHAEPAVMLDAVDRALRVEYPDALVTAWIGIFDLVECTLVYASAGHPPPLMLLTNGEVQELDHLTLPIGLRQGHQGHESTVVLQDGAEFWLYTDGLIEATHDIIDGTRRLYEAAHHRVSQTDEHPAATLRHDVIPAGSPDDVAILVVKADLHDLERYLTRWRFDSADARAASHARRAFATSLPDSKFSPNDVANAELVFGELCANIVRYAPGAVDVVLDRSGLQAVLHVLDRGTGFRHISRLPHDPLDESGRGLYIISSMTTEFTVTHREGAGSHARAVLVGRYPASLLREETLPSLSDQIAEFR